LDFASAVANVKSARLFGAGEPICRFGHAGFAPGGSGLPVGCFRGLSKPSTGEETDMSDTAQIQSRQADYWNGEGAARWLANRARRSDPARGAFIERAIERAQIKAGETILEIGCGAGEVAVELARRLGPTGALTALDVSEPILAQAKERLEPFATARTILADASTYPFEPASADLLFSTFGVMFFADPTGAFANLRKAIKPTGRMVFVCWRAQMTGARDVVFELYPHLVARLNDPGPLAFADKDRLEAILTGAGFVSPTFEGLESARDVSNGGGVEGAVDAALDNGPIARLVMGEPQGVKDACAVALRDYFASIEAGGKILQPTAAWVVSAAP
jgi:SAM-dependent methyltransferase